MIILAIDPGKDKCGIAVLGQFEILFKKIVKTKKIKKEIKSLLASYKIKEIIIGDGTSSDNIKKQSRAFNLPIKIVKEAFSTLYARKLYWQDNPPKGLLRFIPKGLLFPPRPIDDYAAVVIGQQCLEK